jgi:hypothetical protein
MEGEPKRPEALKLPVWLIVILSSVLPYLLLWLAISMFPARAETTIIDAGSDTDSNFTGGAAYLIPLPLIPPVTDGSIRYATPSVAGSSFTYSIPAHANWPYVVTLRFVEPIVKAPKQRVFTVWVGNQAVVDHLDIFQEVGYMTPMSRSFVAVPSDGKLVLRFETQVRNAVVSSIEATPLFQVLADLKATETAVLAIFAAKCTRCHGNDIVPGDVHLVNYLDLRTTASVLKGGESGPAIVPGAEIPFVFVVDGSGVVLNGTCALSSQ